jgi:hypothetical protein
MVVDWIWISLACCLILFGACALVAWLIGATSIVGTSASRRLFGWDLVSMRGGRCPASSTSPVFGGIAGIWALFAFRALAAAYLAAVLISAMVREMSALTTSEWSFMNPMMPAAYVFYNTDWAYVDTLVYFICSAVVTGVDLHRARQGRGARDSASRRRVEIWLWIAAELSATAAISVAILFWVFVVGFGCSRDGTCQIGFYSANAHGGIVAWILVEMALDSYEWVPMHFVFPLAFILSWEILAGCIYASAKTFVYAIQDPAQYGNFLAYAFYPFFAAAYVIVFFVLLGINRLFRRVFYPALYEALSDP